MSRKADPNGVQRRNADDGEVSCKGAPIYGDSSMRLLYEPRLSMKVYEHAPKREGGIPSDCRTDRHAV